MSLLDADEEEVIGRLSAFLYIVLMKATLSVSGRGLVALPAEIYPPERIAEFDAGETALSSAMKAAKKKTKS